VDADGEGEARVTLDEIAAEVEARGFHHIPASRIKAWANARYRRVNAKHPWPFLETTATITPPDTIADLRTVLSVVDTVSGATVPSEDRRTILEFDPNLSGTGSALVWYIDGGALSVYPASTNELSVLYLKRAAAMGDADEPLWPEDYHYGLVEGACADAYRNTDNFEAAQGCKDEFDACVADMYDDLMVPAYDHAPAVALTNATDM
jgi:hypothetical protein